MQAVILAAGFGSRLGEVTKKVPKSLIKVNGKPILARQLDALLKVAQVTQIIVVTGYLAEQVENFIEKNYSSYSSRIRVVRNQEYELGPIVSAHKAMSFIDGDFLMCNADHLFSSTTYQKVVAAAKSSSKSIMVCSFRNREPYDDERKIKFYGDGRVGLQKNIQDYDCGYTGLVAVSSDHVGVYSAMVQEMVQTNSSSHPDDLILPLSSKGVVVHDYDLSSSLFLEVDTPQDLERAEAQICLLEAEDE